MSMIDDLKRKTSSYLKGAGKKKDELVDKAAAIKQDYDENQRKKMEGWVYKKETELKELEKTLKKREELIRQKELKLKSKVLVRFVGIAAGLSVIGFFALSLFVTTKGDGRHSLSAQTQSTKKESSIPRSTEIYTRRESAVYSTYGDIDATNPNFDVGNYCLEKEKKGGITFEECLSVAAAKIMSSQ